MMVSCGMFWQGIIPIVCILAAQVLSLTPSENVMGQTTCPCGKTNNLKNMQSPNIIGGEPVTKEYTFMVGLIPLTPKGESICWNIICGGTIISDRHVLTAAHCIKQSQHYSVIAGFNDMQQCDSKDSQIRNILSVKISPAYNATARFSDVAILTLNLPWQFNGHIGPVCLLPPSTKGNLPDKTPLTLLGWGATAIEPEGSRVLMETNLQIESFDVCKVYYSTFNPTQVCAKRLLNGACYGDSGGPMLWLDPTINSYTLIGIISYGPKNCLQTMVPTVGTQVSTFMSWILTETQAKLCTKF